MKTNKLENKQARKNKIIGERTDFKTKFNMMNHALQSSFLQKIYIFILVMNKVNTSFSGTSIQHLLIYICASIFEYLINGK